MKYFGKIVEYHDGSGTHPGIVTSDYGDFVNLHVFIDGGSREVRKSVYIFKNIEDALNFGASCFALPIERGN